MSITESIETTLGTGHRLANLAVAPILPFRLSEHEQNAGRVDLSFMWDNIEQDRRVSNTSAQESPAHADESERRPPSGNFYVQELVEWSGCIKGKILDKCDSSKNDDNALVLEHDEYGCDMSQESADAGKDGCNELNKENEINRSLDGLKQQQVKKGKGRGRPKYLGNLDLV